MYTGQLGFQLAPNRAAGAKSREREIVLDMMRSKVDGPKLGGVKMDEVKREFLFSQGTAVTDQLAVLYHLWGQQTPTLFDPMTIAFVLRPELCPVRGLHIRVEDDGFTREEPGAVNAQVCLDSNAEDFFRFYLRRVAGVQSGAK